MRTAKTVLLCGFMLWSHEFKGPNWGGVWSRYEPWGTYDTLGECESTRRHWVVKPPHDRAVCLPDTLNPNQK